MLSIKTGQRDGSVAQSKFQRLFPAARAGDFPCNPSSRLSDNSFICLQMCVLKTVASGRRKQVEMAQAVMCLQPFKIEERKGCTSGKPSMHGKAKALVLNHDGRQWCHHTSTDPMVRVEASSTAWQTVALTKNLGMDAGRTVSSCWPRAAGTGHVTN